MSDHLMKLGVDVPFISVLTPYKGTEIYNKLKSEGRLLQDRDWRFYNGYNVAFRPMRMTPEGLLAAHRELWNKSFSLNNTVIRILRSVFYLRLGAFLMTLTMNGFYGLKKMTNNCPIVMKVNDAGFMTDEAPLAVTEDPMAECPDFG